ncbi:MAG: hypothetical protein Q9214_007254, partial [Letrouitia sp. 1 TL-2023]
MLVSLPTSTVVRRANKRNEIVEGLANDMTGQAKTLAHQGDANAPNNREEPRKVFAALPPDASSELKKNTIYLDDPSLVWPNVILQRHKNVQELFNRFYPQILYGCGDLNCRTRTCRSRRERISKGPFRPYTHLSACALANYLILQDDPESYFCPNNPSHRSHVRDQDDLRTISVEEYNGVSQIYLQPPKRKDQKSFTQFLYDTLPWKLFQDIRIADGFSQWAPWRNQHEQRTQYDESHNSHVTSCHSGDLNGEIQPQSAEDLQHDLENMNATQTILSPQMLHQLFGMDHTDKAIERIDNEEFPRHTSGLNSTLPKKVRTWGQMKSWAVENALDIPQELLI